MKSEGGGDENTETVSFALLYVDNNSCLSVFQITLLVNSVNMRIFSKYRESNTIGHSL